MTAVGVRCQYRYMSGNGGGQSGPVLRAVDCITVPVPDLESGLRFYRDALGHPLLWRDDTIGQAAVALPDSGTEIVLATDERYEPDWLVTSVDDAAAALCAAGGRMVDEPFDIPVGRIALVADPFDNVLVLLDLSKGRYITDASGSVTGTTRPVTTVMSAHRLVGVAEIAEMLGASRSRVLQLVDTYDDFPEPDAELASGRIWLRTDIERWIRMHPTRPGGTPSAASGRDTFFALMTEEARHVIVLGQERARLLGHPRIGSEHLLLGLADPSSGIAAVALTTCGATPGALAEAVRAANPARQTQSYGHLPITRPARAALEQSYREALRLNNDVIDAHHVLLGLMLAEESLAIRILRDSFGISPEEVVRTVLELAASDGAPSRTGDVDLAAVLERIDRLAEHLDDRLAALELRLDLDD